MCVCVCVLGYLKEKDLPKPEVADVTHSILVQNSLHLRGNGVESNAHILSAGVATVEGEIVCFQRGQSQLLVH